MKEYGNMTEAELLRECRTLRKGMPPFLETSESRLDQSRWELRVHQIELEFQNRASRIGAMIDIVRAPA